MGVNVCLVRDGYDIEEWDWCRHSGDRELARAIALGDIRTTEWNQPDLDMWLVRPAPETEDLERFCATLPHNEWRWLGLCAILRSDPTVWIYLSY